jgi:hypothetical protein
MMSHPARLRIAVACSLLFAVCLLSASAAGFETDLLNLKVPSSIKPGTIMLDIEHRLPSDFSGANVALGLRGMVWSGLELNGAYSHYMFSPRDSALNEYWLGFSYAHHIPGLLRVQGDVQYFSYAARNVARRLQNVFGLLSIASEPIARRVTPVLNVGYDGSAQHLGLGAGLNFGFPFNVGPFRQVDICGEYSPVLARDTLRMDEQDAFAAGITFETYGHHFQFLVGNSPEIGTRRMMLGATSRSLYLGFNIHRFLDLKSF